MIIWIWLKYFFCNNVEVFTDTFNQGTALLLNTNIHLFYQKSYFWMVVYLNIPAANYFTSACERGSGAHIVCLKYLSSDWLILAPFSILNPWV